ncbi:MAG: hypothetical protein GY769_14445 [bacterium]|nr:hypothetical protein [bacterium]
MSHTHYTPFTLALDFDGQNKRFLSRLKERADSCSRCRSALRELRGWLTALDHPDPLVGPEFVTRHGLFKELLADHPSHEVRLRAADTNALFHQWGLVRLLLEESKSCREVNPLLSAELAELSLIAAEHLEPHYYDPAHVADAQAQASANYGDALRLLERSQAARRQFASANGRLEIGTGRTKILSEVARLEARLLHSIGRHEEAHRLLERTLAAHEEESERSRPLLHFLLEARDDDANG